MKKSIVFAISTVICLSCFSLSCFSQQTGFKQIHYAKTTIDVPDNYFAKDEFSIENKNFSASWIYLTMEMVEQGVADKFLKQIESQITFTKSARVQFTSDGHAFIGKKYTLKDQEELGLRIIAFGICDDQPLILNMAFKDDPFLVETSDPLVKTFFQKKM